MKKKTSFTPSAVTTRAGWRKDCHAVFPKKLQKYLDKWRVLSKSDHFPPSWQPLNSRDPTVKAQTKQLAFTCAPNYKKKGNQSVMRPQSMELTLWHRFLPPWKWILFVSMPLPSHPSPLLLIPLACGHLPSRAAEAGAAGAHPWSRLFTSRLNRPRANSCGWAGCLSLATSPLLSASFVPNYGERASSSGAREVCRACDEGGGQCWAREHLWFLQ